MLRGGGSSNVARWVNTSALLASLDGGLTKHASNPVLAKGAAGQWDDWAVRELGPVVDEWCNVVTESDGIWAYYWGRPDDSTGPFRIGLAKSTDSGVTWTRYASNPVLVPAGTGWYQNDIYQPSVVKQTSGSRVMMAAGRDLSDTTSIGCFTSLDGLTWTDEGVKLELADFTDGGAVAEVNVPSLIRRSAGDWLCLVEARKSGVANGWRIFGATTSDPTGTWTPLNAGAPLLSPTGSGWESVGVANPHIVETEPGQFVLIYNGFNTFWQIGVASTTDLSTWTRYSGNPVLTKGAADEWDDQQVETSFLFKEAPSTDLRMLYQGYSAADGTVQVGLATS